MKRLDMSIILSVCFLIILIVAGCDKEQQLELDDAEAYTSRGLEYLFKGQYDKAISDFNKAIEINPKYAEAYNNRAAACINLGKKDRACNDWQKACELGYCKGLNRAKQEGICQ